MTPRPRARRVLAAWTLGLAVLAALPRAGIAQAPPVAQLGIELPAIGGPQWAKTRRRFYSRAAMADIRDALHLQYVRTGWIFSWRQFEKVPWYREDRGMQAICGNGLHAAIIVPAHGGTGQDALLANVSEFFARYTARHPGCISWAEIGNEADLPVNGFTNVEQYARYYERVAPIVASFGIPVVTSGVSGKDLPWTARLAGLLRAADPPPPVDGYGFHPYGVSAVAMNAAVAEMRQAAAAPGGPLPPVFVTEIGVNDPAALYATIVGLAHATPAITIYEYRAQLGVESPQYALLDNPALYDAVRRASAQLASER